MGVRSVLCALLPVLLALAALISLLLVVLAGISHQNFDLMSIRTKDLSISSSEAANLAKLVGRDDVLLLPRSSIVESDAPLPTPPAVERRQLDLSSLATDASDFVSSIATRTDVSAVASAVSSVAANIPGVSNLAETAQSIASGNNITAKDLGLAESYRIFLWNYCAINGKDKKCSSRGYNWAAKETNSSVLVDTAKKIGVNLELPEDLTTALSTFSTALRWAEIVYTIAAVTMSVVFVLGLAVLLARFCDTCVSGKFPCIVHLLSWVATFFILAGSVLATVIVFVSTKALNNTTKAYGVTGESDSSFLTTTWISFIFALSSTIFWAAACCCPSRSSSHKASSEGYAGKRKGYAGLSEKFGLGQKRGVHDEESEQLKANDYRNSALSSTSAFGANPAYSPHPVQAPAYSPYVDQTPRLGGQPTQYSPMGSGPEHDTGFGHGAGEYPMQNQVQHQSPGVFANVGFGGGGQQRSNTGEGYENYRHQ